MCARVPVCVYVCVCACACVCVCVCVRRARLVRTILGGGGEGGGMEVGEEGDYIPIATLSPPE